MTLLSDKFSILPVDKSSLQPQLWRQILRQNFTDWQQFADFLELSLEQRQEILAKPRFTLNVPMRIAGKIAKRQLDDPLLIQFLPIHAENERVEGFVSDPVNDGCFSKTSKLLHKYQGRALLVCTSACAMHCRFCFRQNYDYDTQSSSFENELKQIASDATIHEVILSGGDPLSLSNKTLCSLLESLGKILHVRRIRFHTRFPIGIPERITNEFLAILENSPQQIWFVIHCNHPRELDDEILTKLKQIQKLGIPVLNQAVLLRGVNDNATILKELCERLADHGILPYYLHQLDRVHGTAHFEVSEQEGLQLMQKLAAQLSGYAVPKYVREIAGQPNKTILG